mmetsp:Transcript_2907/g.11734  ORF Transcript_2907/g.11734 Transcript_2907/m.11734 type:complete len:532 (-) Transcript_2907:1185-2780(-)
MLLSLLWLLISTTGKFMPTPGRSMMDPNSKTLIFLHTPAVAKYSSSRSNPREQTMLALFITPPCLSVGPTSSLLYLTNLVRSSANVGRWSTGRSRISEPSPAAGAAAPAACGHAEVEAPLAALAFCAFFPSAALRTRKKASCNWPRPWPAASELRSIEFPMLYDSCPTGCLRTSSSVGRLGAVPSLEKRRSTSRMSASICLTSSASLRARARLASCCCSRKSRHSSCSSACSSISSSAPRCASASLASSSTASLPVMSTVGRASGSGWSSRRMKVASRGRSSSSSGGRIRMRRSARSCSRCSSERCAAMRSKKRTPSAYTSAAGEGSSPLATSGARYQSSSLIPLPRLRRCARMRCDPPEEAAPPLTGRQSASPYPKGGSACSREDRVRCSIGSRASRKPSASDGCARASTAGWRPIGASVACCGCSCEPAGPAPSRCRCCARAPSVKDEGRGDDGVGLRNETRPFGNTRSNDGRTQPRIAPRLCASLTSSTTFLKACRRSTLSSMASSDRMTSRSVTHGASPSSPSRAAA